MSAAEFCATARIGSRYLRYIEAGTRNLNIEVLVRLANALEVEPADLLRNAEPVTRPRGRPAIANR